MKNTMYTFKTTRREDFSIPNNNYSEETDHIITTPPYNFLDWLNSHADENSNFAHAEQDGNTYYIIGVDGEKTGETYMVINETETDMDICD